MNIQQFTYSVPTLICFDFEPYRAQVHEHNLHKNLSTTIADIMRNLTVRFERTKLVALEEGGDQGVYDVSDTGVLLRVEGCKGFLKHGRDEPGVSESGEFISLGETERGSVSGKCVSLIENVAAFSCGAVVSWDWTAAFSEGAEVVGNVVSTLTVTLCSSRHLSRWFFKALMTNEMYIYSHRVEAWIPW